MRATLHDIFVTFYLQEIMDVEHLWHYNEREMLGSSFSNHRHSPSPMPSSPSQPNSDSNPDFLSNLCNIADHRLYKIVKWCKSLPLFKNISVRHWDKCQSMMSLTQSPFYPQAESLLPRLYTPYIILSFLNFFIASFFNVILI